MKRKFIKKPKIIIGIVVAVILILGITAYVAANRFLFEHVELDLSKTSSPNLNIDNKEESINDNSYTADDNSYKSDSKSINIEKVVTGEGKNTVTYYVADVTLKNGEDLKSAFAKDKFGANIIEYPSVIAKNSNAILAINGDYYGFRDTGIVIRNGVVYRDSPAREGLAIYKDGTMKVYDEKSTSVEKLLQDGVLNTLSFGPSLLNDGNVISGIENIEIDTNFGNHSIQGYQPRTGIGIISPNHFMFVVVDGRSAGYSKGVTMIEFAEIFKNLGCTTAYNIDGGGSSEMYFMDEIINIQ